MESAHAAEAHEKQKATMTSHVGMLKLFFVSGMGASCCCTKTVCFSHASLVNVGIVLYAGVIEISVVPDAAKKTVL